VVQRWRRVNWRRRPRQPLLRPPRDQTTAQANPRTAPSAAGNTTPAARRSAERHGQ
jgi:hypothetical protein